MDTSAVGGSDRKLFLPLLQNGTNAVVFMFPAIRSGLSVKNNVTPLTPSSASLLPVLLNIIPFAVCTNRKSAVVDVSGVFCARADSPAARLAANAGAATSSVRLLVMVITFHSFD